ncbi:MAG: O-antigen ligase family protein [Deltaproteobacteria bacterium]|nr:O-antigen ligase family protein [Deltaproteobacteria bacterium]
MISSGAATRLRRGSDLLLLVLIFVAPLAIGGVHRPVRIALFSGAALALLLSLIERWRDRRPLPITVPLVALGVAFLVTALQLVPLPAALLATIAPATHEVLTSTLGDYGWHAISLDPAGTVGELAKLGGYVAFVAAAVTFGSRTTNRRRIVLAVVGAALLVAIIGFLQTGLGSLKILGFYKPDMQILNEIWVRGTFVNPNHFGALMCLAAPCALAIGMRERRLRVPAFLAVIVFNVAVVMSLSRSALVAAPLAQLLVFGLDRWQLRRGSEHRSASARATLGVAVVATIAIAIAASASRIERVVANTRNIDLTAPGQNSMSKFYAWRGAGKLILMRPWTGSGRGAFEHAFTRVAENGGEQRYRWVENGYLQAVADWGVPVAALLLVLSGTGLFIAIRRLSPDPLAIGPLCALIGLAVHDVVDFSVELPGIALPALALVGVVFGQKSSEPEPGRRLIRTRAPLLLAPLLLAAPLLPYLTMRTADADGEGLVHAARTLPPARLLALAQPMIERHPADWFLQAVVAERLARASHPATMKWLNRAIYLNPSHPGAHIIAASVLASNNRGPQALVEFRIAANGLGQPWIWDQVARRFSSRNAIIAATPNNRASLLGLATWFEAHKREADADHVLGLLLAGSPEDVRLLDRRTRLALSRGDIRGGRQYAAALWKLDRSMATRLMLARAELAAGQAEAAASLLEQVYEHPPELLNVELELVELLVSRDQIDAARQRLDRLTWDLDRTSQIRLHVVRAALEHKAGNEHQYRWELEQASRLRSTLP